MQYSGTPTNTAVVIAFALAVYLIQWVLFDTYWFYFEAKFGSGLGGHPGLLAFALLCIAGLALDVCSKIPARWAWLGVSLGFVATILHNTYKYWVIWG